MPETEWVLEYSPETFSMTELPVALEACNAAIRAWDAGPGRPIIINLPTTVENATPNIYADQIEWMSTHLERREHVVLSLHTHNDRGTGCRGRRARPAGRRGPRRRLPVRQRRALRQRRPGDAGAELLLAGHPSRAWISPTSIPSRAPWKKPRACPSIRAIPYVGDLVFTAFSGSHQDAIKKGFAAQKPDALWEVPYIPVDPADLGRTYDSIDPRQQPVGQGRHRLSSRTRLRRRDAAAHAGGVQRAGAARDGRCRDRDDLAAALGVVRDRPTSPPIST